MDYKISELVDRIAIENIKVSHFENLKRQEHRKQKPDIEKIAGWDNQSRNANEERSRVKNLLDQGIKELVEKGKYDIVKESRTF